MSKNLAFADLERFITTTNDNIVVLANTEGQLVETLHMLTDYAQRLEGRVQALENIKLVVRAPKSSKLFLLTACGLSAYAAYKYTLKRLDDEPISTKSDDEEYLKSRVDHPAGRKINGHDTPADKTTDNPEK